MNNPFSVSCNLTDADLATLYRLQVREQADFALFGISLDGRMTTWNRGVEHIFGYSEQDWLGQHSGIIFVDDDNARGIAQHEMTVARQSGRSANIRWHRRKDGSRVYLRGVLTALRDEHGTFLGFSKTVVDDTARKNLEDALTQSNLDLQQFAFAASHDLQEPLRTVSIYAEVLTHKYRGKLDPEADKILQAMLDATERMSTLITDLLAYSQLTLQEAEVASVDLNEDWESAVSLLRTSIEQLNAMITHDPLPQVNLDRSQLVRLFQNLLANAIKFRKPGEVPRIHAWAERRDEIWVIRVKDNGIGFSPDHAAESSLPSSVCIVPGNIPVPVSDSPLARGSLRAGADRSEPTRYRATALPSGSLSPRAKLSVFFL